MQKFILLILDFFDFFYKKKIVKFLIENNLNKFDIILDVGGHKGEYIWEIDISNICEDLLAKEDKILTFANAS